MATIDKLRAVNKKQSLNVPTVVEEDVAEIEEFFGITDAKESKPAENIKAPQIKVEEQKKRGPGRPKTRVEGEMYSQIHVNLPESLKQKVMQAITCHRSNMNSYIISLIEKDIAANGDKYEDLYNSLAMFN